MMNARVIFVKERNANSGKVSLQVSDVVDYVQGKLKLLIVVNEKDAIEFGHSYEGDGLRDLMVSALKNGTLYNKSTGDTFYLATR